jgi:hypothetical protein
MDIYSSSGSPDPRPLTLLNTYHCSPVVGAFEIGQKVQVSFGRLLDVFAAHNAACQICPSRPRRFELHFVCLDRSAAAAAATCMHM